MTTAASKSTISNGQPPLSPTHTALKVSAGGIAYIKPNNLSVRLTVADRLGSNPAASADGKDTDGTKDTPRIWFAMSKSF